jgi:hypothetical protein
MVLRSIFHIETEADYMAVKSVYKWVDAESTVFYTSTREGQALCFANGLKHRYIKDIRIMVWEMARWKPCIYVDMAFTPATFPRNGETRIFLPSLLKPPMSKKLLLYDYVFCPSKAYADIIRDKVGVRQEDIRVVGYPKLDVYGEDINTKTNFKVFPAIETSLYAAIQNGEEQELAYKPDGNAGLRVATLLHKLAITNNNLQITLPSEAQLRKYTDIKYRH